MMLSDGQLAALRNLAQKQAGYEVDWICIAEARALTDLGLAARTREGWEITVAGLEFLGELDPEALQALDRLTRIGPRGPT